MTDDADQATIVRPTREDLLSGAMMVLMAPVPSTKFMAPKERAQFLHAEMERRIKVAREAYYG